MPLRLNHSNPDFRLQFAALLADREQVADDVSDVVRAIIDDVKARGDAALIDYTKQFDALELTADNLAMSREEIDAAQELCADEVVDALKVAAKRLREYHEKQLPNDVVYTDEHGTTLGWRWRAIDRVGLYVPGGRASYPSSVLHNAIAAKVAGAKHLSMVVPTPKGEINPAVLVAAELAGVDVIYRVGGAQAVAALAYGTDSIEPVDSIVGPGNKFVAEAKRQVYGKIGIDMIAGPSEILVVADDKNDPMWIAADLLSQAEHDPASQSILITDSQAFADKVAQAVDDTLATLEREHIARASWESHGAIITVGQFDEAVALIDAIAPEHLELAIDNPDALAENVSHAGAIFLGRYTPEAIGDYVAGPSHVLPTSHTARFSSGLSVYDFIKKTSIIGCSKDSIRTIGGYGETLAKAEGLGAHALSIRHRLD